MLVQKKRKETDDIKNSTQVALDMVRHLEMAVAKVTPPHFSKERVKWPVQEPSLEVPIIYIINELFERFFWFRQDLEAKPFRLGVLKHAQVHLLCRGLQEGSEP